MTWTDPKIIAYDFLVRIWQERDLTLAREKLHPDIVRRHPRAPTQGLEPYLALIDGYHRAFPGFTNEILSVTGDANTVAVHYRSCGCHTGWWGKIPPSHRSGVIEAIDMYHLRDGQMIEAIPLWDELGIVEQLGLTMVNPLYFVRAGWHGLRKIFARTPA